MTGPLDGLRVFDMTRVLAGPSCTQILGDLGADVIKIERPGSGDDTRRFAPPFLKDAEGNETAEAAYFMSTNRNKRSLTLDFTSPEGQEIARRMIAKSDIVIENFKVGTLAKYGLGYEQLKEDRPDLIYCSTPPPSLLELIINIFSLSDFSKGSIESSNEAFVYIRFRFLRKKPLCINCAWTQSFI